MKRSFSLSIISLLVVTLFSSTVVNGMRRNFRYGRDRCKPRKRGKGNINRMGRAEKKRKAQQEEKISWQQLESKMASKEVKTGPVNLKLLKKAISMSLNNRPLFFVILFSLCRPIFSLEHKKDYFFKNDFQNCMNVGGEEVCLGNPNGIPVICVLDGDLFLKEKCQDLEFLHHTQNCFDEDAKEYEEKLQSCYDDYQECANDNREYRSEVKKLKNENENLKNKVETSKNKLRNCNNDRNLQRADYDSVVESCRSQMGEKEALIKKMSFLAKEGYSVCESKYISDGSKDTCGATYLLLSDVDQICEILGYNPDEDFKDLWKRFQRLSDRSLKVPNNDPNISKRI